MKNHFLILAVVLTALTGCKKEEVQQTTDTPAIQPKSSASRITSSLNIDSLTVADLVVISKTLTLDYHKKLLVFSGLNKTVLDSLYKGELYDDGKPLPEYSKAAVDKTARLRMQKYFVASKEDFTDFVPAHPQKWNQNSEMNLFDNKNGFLTVQYTGDGYTGGAHGYAYENYQVIDLAQQKKLMLNDIVDVSAVNWNTILLNSIGQRKSELFEPNTLTYNQNFYFDANEITFVYGQYEIGPYAAGIIDISVPFAQITNALKPDFKARMSIK